MSSEGVRRLGPSDLKPLLALQRQVLSDTISARVGPRFNALYHRTMLASDDYLCDGYYIDNALVGYLSYTADTTRLLVGVFRRHVFAYVAALAADITRAPRTIGLVYRVAHSVFFAPRDSNDTVGAELLSVGVLPRFRGARAPTAGARSVADALLQSALTNLRARGVRRVRLVSKPVDIDPVPHRFLRKYAFTPKGRVRRFGLDCELYVLELESAGGKVTSS